MTRKAPSKGKLVGYVRVSTLDQNTDRQLDGVDLDKVFTDKASGKDVKRPQLQAALDYVREGDTLICHSMDRLARNNEDLLRTVRELAEKGVAVQFLKEGLTFTGDDSPMNQLLLSMLGAVAQFERALIRERQREGISQAKLKGVYKGRKAAKTPEQIEAIRAEDVERKGKNRAELARLHGVSRETLYQYLNARNP
jgi:DNA invertase Pin-like site-specific DNA recombinase